MSLRRAATSLVQRISGVAEEANVFLGAKSFALEGSLGADSVRHASNQAVKMRIRAIKNIGKITKAMKMVAASKMRAAQVAVDNSRGIVDPFYRLFGDYPAVSVNKELTLAITSDKGLCGGLNSSITKHTKTIIKMSAGEEGSAKEQTIVSVGDKGRAQLARAEPHLYKLGFADTYKAKVTFSQASTIAEELLKYNPDAVRVIFNKFYSAISFKPTISTILTPSALERQLDDPSGNRLDAYEVESTHERSDVLQDLAEFQLAATVYNAMLENNCSESASRMSAMENSTKSAGDMLNKLTLSYNRKRQSTITTELIEIIAGASALMDT
ncbi:hypothetical protein CEUSTIGMA_g13654.t1 [Chlamydomonas eustigma]|uniref:F-ATPase gamma subunit n=1 Tax=Chlamydomonas eustigma TaxID=1157962 RepID=A0A250XRK8_9CHLO|nr:hypothetical protein CEUSTIGMA_g12856.t1 [Chlamydomonas eustigma]GAX86241.1 hypothetical protein CEUSTIGMA_g13654.t1 [Chlamydomonas eustigma]|eukprot:GAX85440.1 hypothetical protein CEUSTIGMA_g12856.t1 [Chlamydomonas eustigma]